MMATSMIRLAVCLTIFAMISPLVSSTMQRKLPIVIAHRGASYYLPEETLEAYNYAAVLRTDYLETDLCSTKDHHLLCHHDCELSSTTDVASRPEFASKFQSNRTYFPNGGYFTEQFTLPELKTLRTVQPFQFRDQRFDDLYSLTTIDEFLQNAAALSYTFNKTFGVYIEMKTPSYFASIGLPMEDKLLEALTASATYGPTVCHGSTDWCPVFLQCFESTALLKLKTKAKYPLIQLIGSPTDLQADTNKPFSDMMTSKGLSAISKYAAGIGPDKYSLIGTTLLQDAHSHQLLVHPWTFRENTTQADPFLNVLRAELEDYYKMGVDGVFTDLPDVALSVRQSLYSPEPMGLNWRIPMVCFFLGFLLALGLITGLAECSKVKLYSTTVNSTNDGTTTSNQSAPPSPSPTQPKRDEEEGLIAAANAEEV